MLDWLKKQVKGVGNFLGVGPEHKLGGQRVQQTPPPRTSAPPLLTPQFRVKLSDLGQRPQISGLSQPSDTNTRFRPQLTPIKTTPTPQFVGDQAKAFGEGLYNLGKGLVTDPAKTVGGVAQNLARFHAEVGLTGLSAATGKNKQWAVDSDIEKFIFGQGDVKKYGSAKKDILKAQGYSEADITKFGPGFVAAAALMDFGPGKVVKGGAAASRVPIRIAKDKDIKPGGKIRLTTQPNTLDLGARKEEFQAPIGPIAQPSGRIRSASDIKKGSTTLNLGPAGRGNKLALDLRGGQPLPDRPTRIRPDVLPPEKSLGLLTRVSLDTRDQLRRLSEPTAEIAARYDDKIVRQTRRMGEDKASLPTLLGKGLSKSEKADVIRAVIYRQDDQLPNPLQRQAAQEWRSFTKRKADEGDSLGVLVGRREDYFTQYLDDKIFKEGGKRQREAVDALVNEVKFTNDGRRWTPNMAISALRGAGQQKGNPHSIQDFDANLQATRDLNLPERFYLNENNIEGSIMRYIEGTSNRLADAEVFGADRSIARGLLDEAEQVHNVDSNLVRSLTDTLLENKKGDPKLSRATGAAMTYQSFTKLGKAGISNLTQYSNAFSFLGGRNLAEGAARLVADPKMRELVDRSGVAFDTVLQRQREGFGVNLRTKTANVVMPFFNPIERGLRERSAAASIVAAERAAAKLAKNPQSRSAKNVFDRLGFDPEIAIRQGGKLTDDQLMELAVNGTILTQFLTIPGRLSPWMTDAQFGKLAIQFKTFSYNQTRFVYDLVKRAIGGDVAPLARYLPAAVATGTAAMGARDYINNLLSPEEREDKSIGKRLVQGLGAGGGLGLPTDLGSQLSYGSDPEDKALRSSEFALGPTFTDLFEGSAAVADFTMTGNTDRAGKFALKRVPVIGTTLKNAQYPYQSPTEKRNSGKMPPTEIKSLEKLEKEKERIQKNRGTAFGLGKMSEAEKSQKLTAVEGQIRDLKFSSEKDPVKKEEMLRDVLREKGGVQEINNKLLFKGQDGKVQAIDLSPTTKKNKISGVVANPNSVAKELMGAWADQGIDDATLDKHLKKLGVDTPEKREGVELDLVNDWTSGEKFSQRSNYFIDRYKSAKPEERDAFLTKMLKNKILTQNVPVRALELGLINEEQANYLKNVIKNWDKYKKVEGTGSGGGSGASSGGRGSRGGRRGAGSRGGRVSIPDVKAPAKSTIKTDVPEMSPMKANKERLAPKISGVSAPSNRVSVKLGRPSKQRKSNKKLRFR